MKATSKSAVSDFRAQRTLALVGASRTGRKFGNTVAKELRAKGYAVVLVHPSAGSIGGEKCYPSLRDLPEPVGGLVTVTKPAETEAVVRDAAEAGIKRIWMQQGSQSEAALAFCAEKGISVVSGECLLMFLEPVGFPHNVHRCLWRWLGKLPA